MNRAHRAVLLVCAAAAMLVPASCRDRSVAGGPAGFMQDRVLARLSSSQASCSACAGGADEPRAPQVASVRRGRADVLRMRGGEDDNFDYYQALGLERGCSAEDVRKAYRKQALKSHPDKNPDNREQAEVQFKRVSEAYEVLSNPHKRAMYDQYGKDGPRGGEEGFDFNFRSAEEIFAEVFGGQNPFEMLESAFGSALGGMAGSSTSHGRRGGSFFGDSLVDDLFGGMGGSMGMGGFGARGESMSVTTQTFVSPDGRRVTRTTKQYADGRQETQEFVDGVQRASSSSFLRGDGGGASSVVRGRAGGVVGGLYSQKSSVKFFYIVNVLGHLLWRICVRRG